ncbi:MAG: PKD domain-containing protein [Ferruginibacter sp.]
MTRALRLTILPFLQLIACLGPGTGYAQDCPPNIDFEAGNFSGWNCYTGRVQSLNGTNIITLTNSNGPVANRHTLYSPGAGYDEYGFFPKNCPNGSNHSIKLGNDEAGTQAEGVSYDFTVPPTANIYNLIYNYAVVFQDPAHQPSEQPRMEIEITNLTDNQVIYCSSFTFYPIGSALPGFEESPVQTGNAPVWYKKWTAVSINLNGNAGKRIRLFFKTADCTFRRHFGYAYIDVNSECSDKFPGAAYCPDDTAVYLTAPYGYAAYTWYNHDFTQVLGTDQTLALVPPPPAGSTVAVVVTPYEGYGCTDTLYTALYDTLHNQAFAGFDQVSCNHTPVQLGNGPPREGWTYHWSPATGLSDPEISNPMASPATRTSYVLEVQHNGGGCYSTDTVVVDGVVLDTTIQVLGPLSWCIGSGDSTVLQVQPADSIQWIKDGVAMPGVTGPRLRVTQTGTYQAVLFSFKGCTLATRAVLVTIASVPHVVFDINRDTQCLVGNKFIFTNNSTNQVGAMQYLWRFGDNTSSTARAPSHSYAGTGNFIITLVVNSSDVCADSTRMPVTVFPSIKAEFSIEPTCINLPVQAINNTVDPGNSPPRYLWDFGNGQTSTLRNPPPQVYQAPGNYVMTLSASTELCPTPASIQRRFVYVEGPRTATRYRDKIAVIHLPLELSARSFGEEVLWSPATELNDASSFHPVFTGSNEQLYTIRITTAAGCITVDTQLVKIAGSIQVLVPNAFTPNNDTRNDVLTPLLIGIKSVNYFRIYNRWGELLYETHNKDEGWDGRLKGVPAETQTVVWMFEGVGVDDKIYARKGSTVLLR